MNIRFGRRLMGLAYVLGAVAATTVAAQPASANLLVNGSFELNGGAPIRQFVDATHPANWTAGGTANSMIYESNGQDGINAQDGAYYISFGHNGTLGASLSQSFATAIGQSYSVTFYVTQQQGDDPTQQVAAEAFDGAALLGTTSTSLLTAPGIWISGTTLTFTATSTTTTLTFLDTSISSGANWALDNVVVDPVREGPLPAPEPATLFLLGTGLIGIAAVRRRKAL